MQILAAATLRKCTSQFKNVQFRSQSFTVMAFLAGRSSSCEMLPELSGFGRMRVTGTEKTQALILALALLAGSWTSQLLH